MASRRRLARVVVMQTLFETDFNDGECRHSKDEIIKRNIEEHGPKNIDVDFAYALLKGVEECKQDIQSAVQENAPQWPLDRMDTITRTILVVGAYELLFLKEAPFAVVMNEAIEIAKEYGSGESGKFVNGVLNAIAHEGG